MPMTTADDNTFGDFMTSEEQKAFSNRLIAIQESYEVKIMELSVIKELGLILQSLDIYDKKLVWERFFKIIERHTAVDGIALLLLNEDHQTLEIEISTRNIASFIKQTDFNDKDSIYTRVLRNGKPLKAKKNISINDSSQLINMLLIPVINNKKVYGILMIQSHMQESFNNNQSRFFSLVADQISIAVTIFKLYGKMLQEEKQRMMLSRFFSKSVTSKILGSKERLTLGGERKKATVLFADLTGFTPMSEGLEPEIVVDILNEYFSLMTPIIFRHDGALDKIMGDCMLALFGAPISYGHDSLSAVKTAIEMIHSLEGAIASKKTNIPHDLRVSIGINSGEVVAGYVGSEVHLNYTVIGDVVNIAQRIQTIAGGNEILISNSVRDDIIDHIDDIKGLKEIISLPPQKVKGHEKAIEVFKLVI